jgi:hypothetical protein
VLFGSGRSTWRMPHEPQQSQWDTSLMLRPRPASRLVATGHADESGVVRGLTGGARKAAEGAAGVAVGVAVLRPRRPTARPRPEDACASRGNAFRTPIRRIAADDRHRKDDPQETRPDAEFDHPVRLLHRPPIDQDLVPSALKGSPAPNTWPMDPTGLRLGPFARSLPGGFETRGPLRQSRYAPRRARRGSCPARRGPSSSTASRRSSRSGGCRSGCAS